MTEVSSEDNGDVSAVFWRAHDGLPREAPGSEATTLLLLRLAGPLPAAPRILDIGCGPGPATIPLARATGGTVTALDLHEPFLAQVNQRADEAGLADRVTTLAAPMESVPLPAGSVDLLWAEGSAYVMGFDAALTAWRPLLATGDRHEGDRHEGDRHRGDQRGGDQRGGDRRGVAVITEAEWTTPNPAAGAREFWDADYPAMRTTSGNVAAAERLGWDVLATYRLPESDRREYYDPLAARLADLRAQGVAPELLDEVGAEITVRAEHGRDYAYTGYVLRPRA